MDVLLWGVLVGLGTGSMALAFVATVAGRWFVKRRGLVTGILTAGGATGQLVFLPVVAWLAEHHGWRSAALVVAGGALAVVPLVLLLMRGRGEPLYAVTRRANVPRFARWGFAPSRCLRSSPSRRASRPRPGWPAVSAPRSRF